MIKEFRGPTRWLSNFHLKAVTFEGLVYLATENAYQAAKTLDPALRAPFMFCMPVEAKRMGKDLPLREDWEDVKLGIMYDLNKQKFSTNPEKQYLLDTGDEELVEGNYWNDRFWGQCPIGLGENHLGKILMRIREELRNE
jgi:ribA/ribD-fused uncharacterized protein